MAYKKAMPLAHRDIEKTSREAKKARDKALKFLEQEEVKEVKANNPEPVQKGNGFEITIKVK